MEFLVGTMDGMGDVTEDRCLKTIIIDPKRARFCLEPKGHEGKHKTIYLGREMTWE